MQLERFHRLSRSELSQYTPEATPPLLSQRQPPDVSDIVLPADFSQQSGGRRSVHSRRVVFVQGEEAPLLGENNRDTFVKQTMTSKLLRLQEMRRSLQAAINELEDVRHALILATKSKLRVKHGVVPVSSSASNH